MDFSHPQRSTGGRDLLSPRPARHRARVTASRVGLAALFSALVSMAFHRACRATFNHSQFSGAPL